MKKIIQHDYKPSIPQQSLRKNLARLSVKSLAEISLLWCRLTITQPDLKSSSEYRLNGTTRTELIKDAIRFFSKAIQRNKQQIIDDILVSYWHHGLNVLQLAQVDCQVVIEKPFATSWSSCKIYDNFGKLTTLNSLVSVNLTSLTKQLSADISKLYFNHVYMCRHPSYPLVLVRIQLFDNRLHSNELISRRPFFVAIPSSSTFLIRSTGSDMACKIMLQSVENTFSKLDDRQVSFVEDSQLKDFRDFESIFLFSSNSKFSNCLGSWTCYATNSVDQSPLENVINHKLIRDIDEQALDFQEIEDDEAKAQFERQRKRKIAYLKFKGVSGAKIAKYKHKNPIFETHRVPLKKLKLNNGKSTIQNETNEFSSIISVPSVEFLVHNKNPDLHFKIKLAGSDVFGGLHELASETDLVDPAKIPGWLTGEEGYKSGVIKNGKFAQILETKGMLI